MRRPSALAPLLLLAASCGPRVEPMPAGIGGYQVLVPNHTLQVATRNGLAVHLPAGTSLTGNSRIQGQLAYCGPAYVGALTEQVCVTQPQENCLSLDGTGPLACFPRFSWTLQEAPPVSAADVAADQGLGFND